jgi:hypothetical protein
LLVVLVHCRSPPNRKCLIKNPRECAAVPASSRCVAAVGVQCTVGPLCEIRASLQAAVIADASVGVTCLIAPQK